MSGAEVRVSGETFIVDEGCDNKTAGNWYCATHGAGFGNNFTKDAHIREGEHELVWNCHLHGLEQP